MELKTIGFLGKIDIEIVNAITEGIKVTQFNPQRKVVNAGIEFLKKQLGEYDVVCDWEAGYDDGTYEFMIDYKSSTDLDGLRKAIENLNGLVSFVTYIH